MKNFIREWPEVFWAGLSLLLWYVLGLLLYPVAATYGLDFLHKLTVLLCRVSVSVLLTELVVAVVFPTVRQWRKSGAYREIFLQQAGEKFAQVNLCTAVYLVTFLAICIAASL